MGMVGARFMSHACYYDMRASAWNAAANFQFSNLVWGNKFVKLLPTQIVIWRVESSCCSYGASD